MDNNLYKLLVEHRVQLSEHRLRVLHKLATDCASLDGEFWECGVFTGGSARLLAEVLRPKPKTLRLFDTFTGFVATSPEDGDFPQVGMFNSTSVAGVKAFVNADFAVLHEGLIPATFAGLEQSKIAFAHLDLDLYEPTKASLEFVLPRMVSGGIIVVDDYGDSMYPGVARAVNEFQLQNVDVNDFGKHDHQAVIHGAL